MTRPTQKMLDITMIAILAIQCGPMRPQAGPLQSSHPKTRNAAQPSDQLTLASQFANPPQTARPQVRFWTSSAAVTDDGLRGDIDSIAKRGFGGIEIDAFPVPKGIGPKFKWGTKAWNHLINVAASEAGKDGLTVDFANGPQWPIAMPEVKSADSPASLYEMTYGSVVLRPGQTYDDVVPPRRKVRSEGRSQLDAVLAYRMMGDKVLDASSVIDMTAKTHIDHTDNAKSTVAFTAPDGPDPWVLFTFWEQPAAQEVEGYYVVDHFSTTGANASNEYWEKVGLPALGKNIKYVRSIFDDSLEYAVTMEWTRGLQHIFKQQHGYDITPYLPLIGFSATFPANDVPGYTSTDAEIAQGVERDYRQTLTTLYTHDFMQPMEQMAEQHGLTVRAQVAYNKPMQIETSALVVGIPETEALGRVSIDMQRYMAGAVHLSSKPFYSIETSAEFQNNYGQTLNDILWWIKRAWAAGVDIQRFHGESYSGEFDGSGSVGGHLPGQTWPGYSAFGNTWSNNWTRQTSPDGLRQMIDYIARTNFIMQKRAKVDVAIYDDSPDIYCNKAVRHGDGQAVYPDGGVLNANGFSYEFVSPALLEMPQAAPTDGRLDINGPAYKALIIHHQDAMTVKVVERLKTFAAAGVRIVIVGDPPSRNSSLAGQLRGHSDTDIRRAVLELVTMPGTATVADYEAVPAALRRLEVEPDAEPARPVDILCQHRTDATGDYYYFYNYNKVSDRDAGISRLPTPSTAYPNLDKSNLVAKTEEYSLAGTGRPYLLNAWTGEITPLPQFRRSGERVQVTVHLAGDDALLIALLTDEEAKRNGVVPATVWATQSDLRPGELVYEKDRKLSAHMARSGTYKVQLESARTATVIASDVQPAFIIQNWSLAVSSIEPPSDGSILFKDSVWRTLGPFQVGPSLKPWGEIDPSLARVSGIGAYSGTFSLDRGWKQGGSAYLDLGEVEGSFTVRINGIELPPQNQVDTFVDIGPCARSGVNRVEIRVASTLYNKVVRAGKHYGLLGTSGAVQVRPYREFPLDPKVLLP